VTRGAREKLNNFTIGDISAKSGVKVPTIRYYEQTGLLKAPLRTQGNRRSYETADLNRLIFIRHARELGFESEAIRTLLTLQDDPLQPCNEADDIAKQRLADVETRIKSLNALKQELERMIGECAHNRISECRVIETLADCSHKHGRLTG
jgi:DNA-binding transcriptional MerR regulator